MKIVTTVTNASRKFWSSWPKKVECKKKKDCGKVAPMYWLLLDRELLLFFSLASQYKDEGGYLERNLYHKAVRKSGLSKVVAAMTAMVTATLMIVLLQRGRKKSKGIKASKKHSPLSQVMSWVAAHCQKTTKFDRRYHLLAHHCQYFVWNQRLAVRLEKAYQRSEKGEWLVWLHTLLLWKRYDVNERSIVTGRRMGCRSDA